MKYEYQSSPLTALLFQKLYFIVRLSRDIITLKCQYYFSKNNIYTTQSSMSTSIYLSCFGAGILFGIGFYCCLRRTLAYQKTRRRQQQYYNNKSNNNPNIIWDWQYHSEKCAQCLTECELCLTNIEHSQHSHLVPFKVDSNDYAIMEPQNVSRGKQNLSIIMEEA